MAVKDLVSGVLTESITTSTTNILVNVAQGISASEIQSLFPTPPFYITIMPKSPTVGVSNRLDSEILQVTAVGSDQSGNASLTCVRGQRDTTAKAFSAGDIVTVGVYAEDAVFLGGEGSAVETPSPWIESSDIKNGAVTSDKIDWATLDYASSTYTGRVKIGPLLIQWGRGSAYVPSGAPGESSELSITFPKAYSVAPTVLLQMEDIGGICGEYAVLFNTTTSGFTGAIGHTLDAVAGTKYYRWLAIGTTS